MVAPRPDKRQHRCQLNALVPTTPRSEAAPEGKTEESLEILRGLAEPLLESKAFKRLAGITFLGILSPRFTHAGDERDGTRADHSAEVARRAVEIAQSLGLSLSVQRYAAAWGLLHDIATWPLSHTSEPAFVRLTGVDARSLREMMVCGHHDLPSEFCVREALRETGVDPGQLSRLFAGDLFYESLELRLLSQVVHCRFTPDTLEGMHRTGVSFGVQVPAPQTTSRIFRREFFDVVFSVEDVGLIREFWSAKSRLYAEYINSPVAIARDTTWSTTIERSFAHVSLARSLFLTEADVRRAVVQFEVPLHNTTDRYKSPLSYQFNVGAAAQITAKRAPVSVLDRILTKMRMGERCELPQPLECS